MDKLINTKEEIERITIASQPCVSVIIPNFDESRRQNVKLLLEDVKLQTFNNIEVIIIRGVAPHGKAINIGCAKAKGEYLLILDDDSRIPDKKVIEILVNTLQSEPSIGMVGASIIIPPYANKFQRQATMEFPRFNVKVVDKVTESDMACHGCCLLSKKVYEKVGSHREDIIRGLDPDLRFRLRKAGYKVVLAPNCWAYHPLPATLGKFLATFFRNGMGSAYCLKYKPDSIVETDESLELKNFKPKRSFAFRIARFPLRLINALLTFRFLRFLAYFIYSLGFIYGLIKYPVFR